MMMSHKRIRKVLNKHNRMMMKMMIYLLKIQRKKRVLQQ